VANPGLYRFCKTRQGEGFINGAETGLQNVDGLDPVFAGNVARFLTAAANAGFDVRIFSAFRTIAHQAFLKKTKGDFAAAPGKSRHGPRPDLFGNGLGHAVDLAWNGSALRDGSPATEWLHANAATYDLSFPLSGYPFEPWHCEPSRSAGKKPAPKTGTPPRAVTDPSPATYVNPDLTQDYRIIRTFTPGKGPVTGINPGLLAVIEVRGQQWTVKASEANRIGGFIDDMVDSKALVGVTLHSDGGWVDRWVNIKGRPQVGSPSNHSRAEAIDMNAYANPQGELSKTFNIPLTRALCAKWGMKWGLDFPTPDPMHFEVDPNATTKVPNVAVKSGRTVLPVGGTRIPRNALENFVLLVLPAAIQLGATTGIQPDFFVTHWSVETGNGVSTGFQRRKNPGNIVGPGPSPVAFTLDTINSYGYRFRVYPTFESGARDYAALLERKYKTVLAAARQSTTAGFQALAASPWDAGHYSGEQVTANGYWSGRNAGVVLFARHRQVSKAINEVGGLAVTIEGTELDATDWTVPPTTLFREITAGSIGLDVAQIQKTLGLKITGYADKDLVAELDRLLRNGGLETEIRLANNNLLLGTFRLTR
jgi:Mannosyl-glycoprotein endo-beta-N-acetylglucosaminidase/D-alanyl-D-alanine carboxypeptidase